MYNRKSINQMSLGSINRELAKLESLPMDQRTVEIARRISDLRFAASQITRGPLW